MKVKTYACLNSVLLGGKQFGTGSNIKQVLKAHWSSSFPFFISYLASIVDVEFPRVRKSRFDTGIPLP